MEKNNWNELPKQKSLFHQQNNSGWNGIGQYPNQKYYEQKKQKQV